MRVSVSRLAESGQRPGHCLCRVSLCRECIILSEGFLPVLEITIKLIESLTQCLIDTPWLTVLKSVCRPFIFEVTGPSPFRGQFSHRDGTGI